MDEAIRHIASYDWILFTSKNGVERFMDRARDIGAARVAAVGPSTAHALARRGLQVSLIPDRFSAEGLLERFGVEVNGARILVSSCGGRS